MAWGVYSFSRGGSESNFGLGEYYIVYSYTRPTCGRDKFNAPLISIVTLILFFKIKFIYIFIWQGSEGGILEIIANNILKPLHT